MDISKVDLNDMKKKGIKALIIFGVVVVLLIAFILIKNAIFGTVLPYDQVEEELVESAQKYYESKKEELPTKDGESKVVNNETLTAGKFMKEIAKMTNEEEACKGEVKVTKNGKNFIYTPNLVCGEKYKTELATEKLIKKAVENEAGLNYNSDTNEYVYRGEYVDNYLEYSGTLWRILKITSDGNIRLIQEEIIPNNVWDDRYNIERESNEGVNNFSLSRIRDSLNALYSDGKTIKKSHSDIVIPQSKCKEYQTSVDKDGNEYQECKTYDYKNQMFTTVYAEEYVAASLDSNCTNPNDKSCANYNYLSGYRKPYWTMTKDPTNTHKVYKVSGSLSVSVASSNSGMRAVVELSGNVMFASGNGSKDKPYKIRRIGA